MYTTAICTPGQTNFIGYSVFDIMYFPSYFLTSFDVHSRDGKVQFGPVLQGVLENYWFGPLIMVNLGPDHWFGPKRSGSGSQVIRTMNWT